MITYSPQVFASEEIVLGSDFFPLWIPSEVEVITFAVAKSVMGFKVNCIYC
jgi:hypothetical protein